MECEQNLIENNMQIDIARLSEFESATEIFAIWLDDKYLTEAYKNTNRAIDFLKIWKLFFTGKDKRGFT